MIVITFQFDVVHFSYSSIILSSPKRQNLNGGFKLGKWEIKLNGSWLLTSHYPHPGWHATNIHPWPQITPSSLFPLIPPHTTQHPVTKKNIICLAGARLLRTYSVLFFVLSKSTPYLKACSGGWNYLLVGFRCRCTLINSPIPSMAPADWLPVRVIDDNTSIKDGAW